MDKETEWLRQEQRKHKGQWLTEEAVADYQAQAKRISGGNTQDIGTRRKLRRELQEKYGLLEIEAVNILNGIHGAFYVEKYRRMQSCTPIPRKPETTAPDKELEARFGML